jgi:type I restriction enzyme S subunit
LPRSELQPTPELRRILTQYCNGIVPEGRSLRRLDDLAVRGTGHTPDRKKSHYWNGGVKWISLADSHRLDQVYISDTEHSISSAGLDNSSAVLHPPGIVVLSRDAGVGKSAVTTCPLAVSQHFVVWDCSSDLHNLYLYYWLQLMKPEFERIANGSTIKTIGMGYFDRLQILVPGREVQEPIAEMLLAWDSAITAARKLVRRRRKLKRGLLQQLLTGERRFPEFRDQPWVELRVGEVLQETSRLVDWSDNELYRLASIRRGSRGLFDRGSLYGRDIKVKKLHTIREGDFLISHIQAAYGAMGTVPAEFDGAKVSDMYSILTPKTPGSIDMRFVNYLSQRKEMRHMAYLSSNGFFAERLRLNFDPRDFLNRKVLLPPTAAEQSRIADTLETLDREIQVLTDLHAALKEQKKGLMQQLLTGKVRVPASMLKEAAHA